MKLSDEQFRQAIAYHPRAAGRVHCDFSADEIRLLLEMARQMSPNAFRHLNYAVLRESCEHLSPQDVAEKLLRKAFVDRLFESDFSDGNPHPRRKPCRRRGSRSRK